MKWMCFFLALLPLQISAEVSALYLSWYNDPTTTMTIQWHSEQDAENQLFWKSPDSAAWIEVKSSHHFLPLSRIEVHHVDLNQLSPGTEYEFKIGSDSTIYHFRTMPQTLDRSITFIVGGNIFESRKIFRQMAQTIAKHDPDFIVFGGNIAHAINSKPFFFPSSRLRHWLAFFNEWKTSIIQNGGRVIPFVIAPGKEDIRTDDYEIFFSLFAFPQKQLYRDIDFGNYLTLFLLDTGNFHPIDGPQSYWLKRALTKNQKRTYRFAVYNESAYPPSGSSPATKKIRTFWCPLFEEFDLQAAFEHQNHSIKRTFPIKGNQIQANGTIYLGEGCWGARPQKTQDQWYLTKRSKRDGVWLVQLTPDNASLQAIDRFNEIIDKVLIDPAANR